MVFGPCFLTRLYHYLYQIKRKQEEEEETDDIVTWVLISITIYNSAKYIHCERIGDFKAAKIKIQTPEIKRISFYKDRPTREYDVFSANN